MNSTRYTALNQYIRDKVTDVNNIQYATSLALAMAIARSLPVTIGEPQTVMQTYDNSFTFSVSQMAGAFNEQVYVNIDTVNEVTRAIWLCRQNAACATFNYIDPRAGGSFADKLFGTQMYFNPQHLAYMNKHAEVLCTISNRIAAVMGEESQGSPVAF